MFNSFLFRKQKRAISCLILLITRKYDVINLVILEGVSMIEVIRVSRRIKPSFLELFDLEVFTKEEKKYLKIIISFC